MSISSRRHLTEKLSSQATAEMARNSSVNKIDLIALGFSWCMKLIFSGLSVPVMRLGTRLAINQYLLSTSDINV